MIHSRVPNRLLFLIFSLSAVACGPDDGESALAGQNAIDIVGAVESTEPAPAGAKAALIWGVSATNPDYSYAYGAGSVSDTGFELKLPEAPPTDALNVGAVGVAFVVAYPDDVVISEGKIDFEPESPGASQPTTDNLLGASNRHAVIYIDKDKFQAYLATLPEEDRAELKDNWISDFPEGYSCGEGVSEAGKKDVFKPIGCDRMILRFAPLSTLEFVDWT